jgi:hypothetical protein
MLANSSRHATRAATSFTIATGNGSKSPLKSSAMAELARISERMELIRRSGQTRFEYYAYTLGRLPFTPYPPGHIHRRC